MIDILRRHFDDDGAIRLLGEVISSFHTNGRQGVGLPLGNLTSQLLVNIYMNEFDHFIKRGLKIKYYVRYADDFVILHENKAYLENILPKMSEFLGTKLKLSLHSKKVFITTLAAGVDFLGWVHFPHHRTLRTSTKRRMFENLKYKKLAPGTIISYLGLLSHGNTRKLLGRIRNMR